MATIPHKTPIYPLTQFKFLEHYNIFIINKLPPPPQYNRKRPTLSYFRCEGTYFYCEGYKNIVNDCIFAAEKGEKNEYLILAYFYIFAFHKVEQKKT